MTKTKTPVGRDSVLSILQDTAPRSIRFAALCARLGPPEPTSHSVREILNGLVAANLVRETPGQRFRIPRRKKRTSENRAPPRASDRASDPPRRRNPRRPQRHHESAVVQGRFSSTPRGFGFVSVHSGGPDIFIPPNAVGSALHGDLVEARWSKSPKGREGEITGVVSRAIVHVCGTTRRSGDTTFFDPEDPRLPGPMTVVGRRPQEAKAKLAVVGEITRYPERANDPMEVRIIEVLGPHGDLSVEVAKLKLQYQIDETFPADVLAEAKSFHPEFPPASTKSAKICATSTFARSIPRMRATTTTRSGPNGEKKGFGW